MRIKDYECEGCDYLREEYFNDTEEIPECISGETCPECGKRLRLRFTAKTNNQRWRHNDTRDVEISS